ARRAPLPRERTLLEAARTIEGAYVPRFYQPQRRDDGATELRPLRPDVPGAIRRACVRNLADSPP
ncbi:MAG TPA: hypothetical protein DCX07_01265, partial [Phycisphaerales bacterium]|nr:hypothetical protein [Phycisphaerales bacterium]